MFCTINTELERKHRQKFITVTDTPHRHGVQTDVVEAPEEPFNFLDISSRDEWFWVLLGGNAAKNSIFMKLASGVQAGMQTDSDRVREGDT